MNADLKRESSTTECAWIHQSRLFRKWEGIKQDILLHKWYESEKAGYDIGWERACVDWMIRSGHEDR